MFQLQISDKRRIHTNAVRTYFNNKNQNRFTITTTAWGDIDMSICSFSTKLSCKTDCLTATLLRTYPQF